MAEAPASKAKLPPGARPPSLGGDLGGRSAPTDRRGGPRPSPSGGRLPRESRRRLYGHGSDRSSARSRSTRRRGRSPSKEKPAPQRESPPRLELNRDTYEALVEASRLAETEEMHIDLIGQFLSSTRSGRYIKKAVVSSIASHIRKWDITVHDFRAFSDNELQITAIGPRRTGSLSPDPAPAFYR